MPKSQRLYKCKHCGHKAFAKTENWAHLRTHLAAEKLLECELCQFVTEYKHHLEYHTRNHTGYKPFECDKCDYKCVNKSMLNSHMKSHSSIYQYQCGDCKYATKYVHSLKMHLRKYNHQPPLSQQLSQHHSNNNSSNSNTSSQQQTPPPPPLQSPIVASHQQTHNSHTTIPIPIPTTNTTTNLIAQDNGQCGDVLDLRVNSKLKL